MTKLHKLDAPFKILVTMFLIVLSAGFISAHLYLHHTVNPEDGKAQLFLSFEDITRHFYGDPGSTRLRHMVLGKMKKYFNEQEDPKKLTAKEQADLDAVLAWNDRGAPEKEYWDPQSRDYVGAGKILFYHGCFDCHAPDAIQKGNNKDAPLDTYPAIVKYTREDRGMDVGRLLMLSHVHLLGMGLIFLGVGLFLALTRYSARVRGGLIFAGFASILLDIGGWWAVKYGGGAYAISVMAGGALMALAFGMSVLAVLYDVWGRKEPPPPAAAASTADGT